MQQIGTTAEKSSVEKELAELRERLAKVEEWKTRRQEIEDELNKVWVSSGNELPPPAYIESEDISSTRTTPSFTKLDTFQRPSDEVIETFKRVFRRSCLENGGPVDEAMAEKLASNAVNRVLDPESMRDVPLMDREQSVIDAFRGALEKSQAPPESANTGP
jgi:hypothetical protein